MAAWRDFLDPAAAPGRYLAWREVARETGLSRTTAWRLQKRDDFPSPYKISPGRVGYRAHEVEAWQASRQRSAEARVRTVPHPAPAPLQAEPAVLKPPEAPARSELQAVRPAPAGRRRRPTQKPDSEHARAIAQQMLFDF